MEDLPEPLVPQDVDLREMDGFLLNVERLLASELWALSTPEEFKAAMGLWCRAWKQMPAASLPDDDRVLAAFAGVQPARWKKIKEIAMRGFILCSDGRFYHKVLSADAMRAWERKVSFQERGKKGNERRWGRVHTRDEPQRGENGGKQQKIKHEDCSQTIAKGQISDPLAIQERSFSDPELILNDRQLKERVKEVRDIEPIGSHLESGFEEFYQAYPRHVGKGQARKAYRTALKKTDPPILLATAKAFALSVACKDREFIAHPSTWLNGERWLDDGGWHDKITIEPAQSKLSRSDQERAVFVERFIQTGNWHPQYGERPSDRDAAIQELNRLKARDAA